MTASPGAGHPGSSTTLAILLHDRHGALERVLAAARRQGCTIPSLALEQDAQPGLVRLRLTIDGRESARLARQLARIVDVVEVRGAAPPQPSDIAALADMQATSFHAQADGVSPNDGDTDTRTTHMEE